MVDLSELYEVYVDQALSDEVNVAPIIKTGVYNGVLLKPRVDQYPDWNRDAAGLYRVNVGVVLWTLDGARVGQKYVDTCPTKFEAFGRPSQDSIRFVQLADALGMTTASIGEIIDAMHDAAVSIYGKEFFKCPVGLFPEDQREKAYKGGATDETERKLYLKTNDDDLRDRLMEAGYESDFAIFSFGKVKKMKESFVDEDKIPF